MRISDWSSDVCSSDLESKRPGQPGLFHARLAPMKIVEVRHPLVQHKLGLMRRADNSTKTFRELAAEVATLLTYEATSDLETEDADVEGWAGTVRVRRIKGRKITLDRKSTRLNSS